VDRLRAYLIPIVLLLLLGIAIGFVLGRKLPRSTKELVLERAHEECWEKSRPREHLAAKPLLRELRRILDWLQQFKGSDEPARVADWCKWEIEKEMGERDELPAAGKPPVERLPEVENLTGLSKERISAALGPPTGLCWGGDGGVLDGDSCEQASVWQYSLYYMPPRRLGGGPELTLVFDENDVCVLSLWDYSR